MSPISCIFLYVEKYQNHEQWHLLLVTSSNLLPKCVASRTPFTKITYILTSTPLLGAYPQRCLICCPWLKSSFCTQIKFKSQFSGYAFFFFSVNTSKAWSCVRFLYRAPGIWKEIMYQNCINLQFTCKGKNGKTGRCPKRTGMRSRGRVSDTTKGSLSCLLVDEVVSTEPSREHGEWTSHVSGK